MKRILLGLATLGVVAGVTLLVTNAFFSDTETSSGNTFQAGKLDLKVDSTCTYNGAPQADCTWLKKDLTTNDLFFNYSDIKPGDTGENTISLRVQDNASWACMYIDNVATAENGCTEPESQTDATCGNPGPGEGELQQSLLFTIWRDTNCNNILDPEVPPVAAYCKGLGESCTGQDFYACSHNTQGCTWVSEVPGIPAEQALTTNARLKAGVPNLFAIADKNNAPALDPTKDYCIGVSWRVPSETGNIIQSDSVNGDVSFYIEQSRNNPEFVCGQRELPTEPSTTPPSPTPTPKTLTVNFSDMNADPQYGYVHDYSHATVAFVYKSPANPTLSGTITATGLKPYATYQVKFEGIPKCIDPVNGNDVANEYIGYAGRWWDNTTNSNSTDGGYAADSIYKGGTHCITGYLVWDFFTADASGNAGKTITTQNSYHVLRCGGGVCGTVSDIFLATPDISYPAVKFCPADKVNGELEPTRPACNALTLATGVYNLKLILTEESFHQGNWTGVMQTPISFELK